MKTILFQAIQFRICTQFKSQKTVLFQVIQFNINTKLGSIRLIDNTLPGATSMGQSGPGGNGNEGVLHVPPNPSIIGNSPPDCLELTAYFC